MGQTGGKGHEAEAEEGFTVQEKGFLDQIFHQMALRSPDDVIDRATFLAFFELPGVLGDRLFEVFDTKKTGNIDFEEFIDGYHKFAKGKPETKIKMLFNWFDLDGKGGISPDELSTVLMSVVTPPQQMFNDAMDAGERTPGAPSIGTLRDSSVPFDAASPTTADRLSPAETEDRTDSGFVMTDDEDYGIVDVQSEVQAIVERSFAACDSDHSGRLSYDQFRLWLERNPELLQQLDELLAVMAWELPGTMRGYTMAESDAASERFSKMPSFGLGAASHSFSARGAIPDFSPRPMAALSCRRCRLKFVATRELIPPPEDGSEEKEEDWDWVVLSFAFDATGKNQSLKFCAKCAGDLSSESRVSSSGSSLKLKVKSATGEEHYEGAVKMTGGRWGRLRSRWVVVHGKFLYVYKNRDKKDTRDIIFIQGYFGEIIRDRSMSGGEHIVSFVSPPGSSGKQVKLHFRTKEEAEKWLIELEKAARTVDIKRFYVLKKKLGKGTFAQVYYAEEKASGREVAVKAIEKKLIDGKQKEYLRVELSIMKLVSHPNVIQLERVFETRHHVYMVMPLYPGGDLFDFMKAHRRDGVSETEGRKLIWNVLQALRYLHSIGIVHRDLKPENLLLKTVDSPCDVVITDFGLSKFAAPHEAMEAACGTLTYVAPEVLVMKGYGKEVDVWSVGIIMYLVLRAKLPFHDSTKQKIIARIMRQKVQLVDPEWAKKSSQSKALIGRLLEKSPERRITTQEALDEAAWFEPLRTAIMAAKATGDDSGVADVTTETEVDDMASGPSLLMIRTLTRRRGQMDADLMDALDDDDDDS